MCCVGTMPTTASPGVQLELWAEGLDVPCAGFAEAVEGDAQEPEVIRVEMIDDDMAASQTRVEGFRALTPMALAGRMPRRPFG